MVVNKKRKAQKRLREEKFKREHKLIDGIDYKICNKHHIHFPEEDPWIQSTTEYFYHNDKNLTDYLYPYCKKCGIEEAKKWGKDHRERKLELATIVRTTTPSGIAYREKRRKIDRATGYYGEYAKRPDVKARKYSSRHRNHDITETEWVNCKDYFKDEDGEWSCAYCGKKIQDHWITYNGKLMIGDFHKDHKDDNGANDIRNCIPGCKDCNCSKWEFDFEEWYRKQNSFTEVRYNKIIRWCTEDYKLYIEDKPPYRIIKKKNKDNNKFHHELWTVDEYRNMVKCIDIAIKKRDLNINLTYDLDITGK